MNKRSKQNETTLLYKENRQYILGDLNEPVSKVEILENLSRDLRIPYPTTMKKLVLRSIFSLCGAIGLLLLGIVAFYTGFTNFRLDIPTFSMYLIGSLCLVGAIISGRYALFLVRTRSTFIEDIFISMSKQHNIIEGKVYAVRHYGGRSMIFLRTS